jgi:4a-hydroxytetrahydrobiopterin dehydratase
MNSELKLTDLRALRCTPQKGEKAKLSSDKIDKLLTELSGWSLDATRERIVKDYRFADFHRTMAFVNAVAYIAHVQDHHPDLEVGYGHCKVHFNTHDAHGISINDFICAAQVEALISA